MLQRGPGIRNKLLKQGSVSRGPEKEKTVEKRWASRGPGIRNKLLKQGSVSRGPEKEKTVETRMCFKGAWYKE